MRVRRLRSRLSDVQRLLYPLVNALIRGWVAVLHRRARFEEHGPLFDYIREGTLGFVTPGGYKWSSAAGGTQLG